MGIRLKQKSVVFLSFVILILSYLGCVDAIAQSLPTSTDSLVLMILQKSSTSPISFQLDTTSSLLSLEKQLKKQLEKHQTVGYPFANYSINSKLSKSEDSILVDVNYSKGELYHFDSLIILSESKQSKLFYSKYLGIKEGELFNQNKIDKISKRIEQLNFVRLSQPPSISFSSKYTRVLLRIDRLKINQLDAIASIQQNTTGETFVNGQAKFKLYNILGKAEYFYLDWQRASLYTQKADLMFDQPFIFKSPIGLTLKANFNRIDSTESSQNFSIGALYFFEGNNTLKLSYYNASQQLKNANDLSVETFVTTGFKGELQLNHVNYFYSPTKGYRFLAELNSGERKNSTTSIVTTLQSKTEWYKKIKANIIGKIGVNTYTTISQIDSKLDYLLTGGLNTLRGFNTNSIKASSFYQAIAEPRLIIGDNSFIFVFFEAAYVQLPMLDELSSASVSAFGGGLNIDTNGGILNLTWALANGLGNSYKLSNSKIHIGYTLLF